MMGDMPGGWSGMWGFGWVFMVLFWALIVFGAAALAKWLFFKGNPGGSGTPGRNSLDILKERYARGEITRDQYAQMRRDLES
jgi:putative membrane protein